MEVGRTAFEEGDWNSTWMYSKLTYKPTWKYSKGYYIVFASPGGIIYISTHKYDDSLRTYNAILHPYYTHSFLAPFIQVESY